MLIYIAGPYTGKDKKETISNIAKARCLAHDCWEAGYATICPHMNTAEFDDISPEVFYIGDLEIMERCDCVLLIPGWEKSFGARLETRFAKKLGIPIYKSLDEIKRMHP